MFRSVCPPVGLSACLCFASFVSHWHSHSQLLYPFSSVCLPPTSRSLHQLMLASEAHTLSLSTHCKLHREQCRVRAEGGERNAFYFFHGTFYFLLSSLGLCFCHAHRHTRVSLWVFSELRPQQFQLCVSLSQDQVTFRYSVAPQRVVYLHFRVCVFRFFLFCFNFTNCRPSLRNC